MNQAVSSTPLPTTFWERLEQFLTPEQLQSVREALSQQRATTFRVNTLKATPEQVMAALTTAGFEAEPVPSIPLAYVLTKGVLFDLTQQPLYTDGWIYVQSLSSMLPPLVLAPQPGELVLDVAAAPGSKTTQMAALMKNQGQILANDTSLVRLYKLQANLAMQGVILVNTQRTPGQELWRSFPNTFDKTLVDVPCSMEGRIQLDKPKTWANWSPKKIKELAMRQRALLHSAVSATKPGGVIVYSTCTLAPEENEGVVQWLLDRVGNEVTLESIELPGVPLLPGLSHWKHKAFAPELAKTARILPSATMEGFYVAKLRKLTATS